MTATPSVITVGYDGSPNADAALAWAASVAAATDATVRIVHAVGLLEHGGFAPLTVDAERAKRLAVACGVDAARVVWRALDGEPASVLVREVEGGADLLVVGTRGAANHPGTLGSTSLELAERAQVPVVVVPRPGVEP